MAKFVDVKVNFNFDQKKAKLQSQIKQVQQLPQRTLEHFKAETPIKTGNARRNTTLEKDNTIHANYPYADRLDNGWSQQAPFGMTKPTEAWLRKEFKKIFGK